MYFQRFLAGLSLAAILSLPAGLQAQAAGTGGTTLTSGGINVLVTSVGDQTNRQVGLVYLGIAQCKANIPVTFELSTVPPGKSIDVYLGENCNAATRTTTTGEGCKFLENVTVRTTLRMNVTLGASSLFVNGCDSMSENKPNIWFLPVNTSQSPEAVSIYGRFQGISADAQPPLAPTSLEAGSGERQIGLHWKSDEPASTVDKIYVFIDASPSGSSTSDATAGTGAAGASGAGAAGASGAGADGGAGTEETGGTGAAGTSATGTAGSSADVPVSSECYSSHLVAGVQPPPIDALPSGVMVKVLNNGAQLSDDIDPQAYGLGRDPAAVAVANVDFAGNVSLASNVVCASAIPTTGFGDTLHQDFGKGVEGCPCSAFGTTQLQSSWPIGLSLCALVLSARRRRTR